MKSTIKYLGVILILGLLSLAACETTDINPDEDVRAPYLGTWSCSETSGMTYNVTVTLDQNNSTQILIGNFHLLGASEKAYAIATTNNLTLPSQVISGFTINGSGNLINNNLITMKYYVNDNADVDTVNATYTK